jgi:LmbE family N-acetylglucosaminyl deacetylase/SAM-dependent methyltransferase
MPATLNIDEHLAAEIATDDPWKLSTNVFELRRYAIMLDMMRAHNPAPGALFENCLEIGCAAGVFTAMLAPHCKSMHVIDVMPKFIERAAARLKDRGNITWEVASVMDDFAAGKTFDLIIVAEVLCYVPDAETLRRTVERISSMLAPGGLLIFGGAIDAVTKRWGMPGVGAEPTMAEWERVLREVNRAACQGAYWGEDTRIVGYTRDANGGLPGASFTTPEDAILPHKAVIEIPSRGALVLAPHPDDEVFGCGGAIARHVAAKVPVRVIVATDGAYKKGAAPDPRRARVREDECRAAAKVLGYGEPIFWNLKDRALAFGEPLIAKVLEAMTGVDLVYAPSLTEQHPDHRILAMAAIEAVRRSPGARLAFYEIGAPQRPNLLLDISQVAGVKQAAIACFRSQLETQRYDEQIAALNRYRTYTLTGNVTAAEAYFLVSSDDLNADPMKFHRPETERHLAEATFAQAELHKMRLLLQERDMELASVYRSTSWKITAPLRMIRRIVGK